MQVFSPELQAARQAATPVLEREMIGRRLLSTSRELYKRIFYLSYAYRMTGDEKHLKSAEDNMVAVARFSDWNPSHFLDVAEMTMGMAIGLDWLYADLSPEARTKIRDAIVFKGLKPSQDSKYNSWLNATSNWNQVCNTGMVYGAMAVRDMYPELADDIIERAISSLEKPMEAYQPDGVYPEGYGYWGYGTTYNVLFLSAIKMAMIDDLGLSQTPGFLQTADFLKHMLTPTGMSFNWSDCGTGTNLKTAMFWFAEQLDDPSVLWSEKQLLEKNGVSKLKGIRELPALLIWGKNIPIADISEPTEKFWMGQGPNPVAMMRSCWDSQALYLGFKAGSPSVNHGHMDIGSFVMESDGVRWAHDLGMQNYESLESLGMKIFGKTQDAERWTVFRMNTYSHNVLIVDGQQQRVDGYAKIDRFSDGDDFQYAISDISSVYEGLLKSYKRGVGNINGEYSIIRDEIETLDKMTLIRWNMLTPASVELLSNEARLTNGGKVLHLKVQGPENLVLKTWSTAPTNNYDAENPGTIMVGFECEILANTAEVFEVLLVPESTNMIAEFKNTPLDSW